MKIITVTIGALIVLIIVGFLLFSQGSPEHEGIDFVFEEMKLSLGNESAYLVSDGTLHFGYRRAGIGLPETVPCMTVMMGFFNLRDCVEPVEVFFLESGPGRSQITFHDVLSLRDRARVDAVVGYESREDALAALGEVRAYLENGVFLSLERSRSDDLDGLTHIRREYDQGYPADWPQSWPAFDTPVRVDLTVVDSMIIYSSLALDE